MGLWRKFFREMLDKGGILTMGALVLMMYRKYKLPDVVGAFAFGVTAVGAFGFIRYFIMDFDITADDPRYEELLRELERMKVILKERERTEAKLRDACERFMKMRKLLEGWNRDINEIEEKMADMQLLHPSPAVISGASSRMSTAEAVKHSAACLPDVCTDLSEDVLEDSGSVLQQQAVQEQTEDQNAEKVGHSQEIAKEVGDQAQSGDEISEVQLGELSKPQVEKGFENVLEDEKPPESELEGLVDKEVAEGSNVGVGGGVEEMQRDEDGNLFERRRREEEIENQLSEEEIRNLLKEVMEESTCEEFRNLLREIFEQESNKEMKQLEEDTDEESDDNVNDLLMKQLEEDTDEESDNNVNDLLMEAIEEECDKQIKDLTEKKIENLQQEEIPTRLEEALREESNEDVQSAE